MPGSAGVDGVRFEDIESYGEDRWLAELRQDLMKETYHPQPVRRVMIPKPGGGERPLGIPTIRDRVAQTAVVLLLGPIFEAHFQDNVYAYRPGRSAHDVMAEVQKRLYGGQEHVVDADVTKYFDTIPHAELLQSVARRVADGKILRLLKLWLKSPVEERDESGNRRMTVSRWLKKLGLTIHPTKTRLCQAREEPFDFLGYTFGPARHWRTGRRLLSVQPSKKAQKRLKEKINTRLQRGNPTPWPELQTRLNRLLSGWAQYFSFGFTGQADDAIGWHLRERARRFLCRRHKLRVSGTGRFGYAEIHGKMGVVDIRQTRPRRRPVHALS